jgi:hypothetical protein
MPGAKISNDFSPTLYLEKIIANIYAAVII